MTDIPLKHAMVCWNPDTDQVAVIPHPDPDRHSRVFERSDGACHFQTWRAPAHRMKWLLQIFNMMVVRDKVDPQAAHRALLVIPEYRHILPADQEGAE